MQELIRVEDVEKYYGRGKQVTKAVNRISFEIRKGEFTGIRGHRAPEDHFDQSDGHHR